jgi:CheY-like chemotaxis protein
MAGILVVDDDEGIRGFVSTVLKSAGHQILTAANGAEGVAVYRTFAGRIDLVITDFNMPVMDGAQEILRIRMTNPNAKVIGMTGNTACDFPEGVVLLNKPFTVEKLLVSVDELLRSSGPPKATSG